MGLRFSKAFQLEVSNGGRGRCEAREGGDLRSKLREVKVVGTANERTGERYKRERERERGKRRRVGRRKRGEKEERGREGMIKEVAS